jgi:hypothetical protein
MKKGYVCQANILALDKELQSQGIYGEKESEVARFCLACILVGAKKRTVEMLANPIKKGNFKRYWENLQKNHYFAPNKKIDIESTDTVPFLLMMNCAQGIIERKEA